MKWNPIHPAQNTYNFEPGDALVAFAQAHQMQIRGHNLCWWQYNPAWVATLAATATPATMAGVLQDHINTVVTHYTGQVFAWDVVNEAVSDSQTGTGTDLKNSIWYNQPGIGATGTGYIEQAFRWAHAADPNALLFYNDYNIEAPGAKFTAVYKMVKDFVTRGVPIHGVGIQMHIDTAGYPNSPGLAQNIQQLTSLGLQVHITEMDVKLKTDSSGNASAADLQAQAQTYQRILTVCLQNPGCTGFQTWGFTDKYSWIPGSYPGFGAALPFDVNYEPKPAFNSLISAMQTAPPAPSAITLVATAEGESPTIAPNTWVEIKGFNLAPAGDSRIWMSPDFVNNQLPVQLDGVSVTVNGKSAYLYFISPTQVNILTPPDALPASVQVQLDLGGVPSNVATVQAQPQSLSFFEFVSSGGVAYVYGRHATNDSLIGPPGLFPTAPGLTTPVKPGESIYVAGNGFGPTDVPVVGGSLTQSGNLPLPFPVVKVGGIPASVSFAGLIAPGTYQINFIVPPDVPDGDLPLTATYDGLSIQPNLFITVQH
jgi:endo-1,4-beta-xylanase